VEGYLVEVIAKIHAKIVALAGPLKWSVSARVQ